MGRRHGKRYSPKFKFNVVLEVLKSDTADAEVARAYDVHPVTVSRWKRELLERGPEVFGGADEVKEYEDRIGKLERVLVGQFTQLDPIGMRGGLNLYGYANSDPVNFRDPSGLSACAGYDDVAACIGGAWDGSNSNDDVIIFDDDCDGFWSCLRALALMEWRGLLAGADPSRTGLTEREGSLGALLGRFSLALPTAWRARPPVAAPSGFTGSLDDVFANPSSLRGLSPAEVQSIFTEATARGWQYGTLRRGSARGLGIRVWDGGNRMISWHPGGGHHGARPYWKVSQTGGGTVRVPAGGASPWSPPPWGRCLRVPAKLRLARARRRRGSR